MSSTQDGWLLHVVTSGVSGGSPPPLPPQPQQASPAATPATAKSDMFPQDVFHPGPAAPVASHQSHCTHLSQPSPTASVQATISWHGLVGEVVGEVVGDGVEGATDVAVTDLSTAAADLVPPPQLQHAWDAGAPSMSVYELTEPQVGSHPDPAVPLWAHHNFCAHSLQLSPSVSAQSTFAQVAPHEQQACSGERLVATSVLWLRCPRVASQLGPGCPSAVHHPRLLYSAQPTPPESAHPTTSRHCPLARCTKRPRICNDNTVRLDGKRALKHCRDRVIVPRWRVRISPPAITASWC